MLVNCAGIGKFANAHDMPFEDWSRIIAVNLTGSFLMAQAVLPHLLEGGGNIVNIASNAGLMGQPYSAAYCASKGGVIQLTRALADEYLRRGVRVNASRPAAWRRRCRSLPQLPEGADPKLLAKLRTPLGTATPDEVARWSPSSPPTKARYMTGAIVSIDGGLTI